MPTIKDVAAMAGVSIATVSNVLNGSKRVSPELDKKVREAVQFFGYKPDPAASGLKSRRSMVIGFIIPSIDSVFFPQVIRGIQRVSEEKGYMIHFYTTNYSQTAEQKYIQMLLHNRVDGIILDSVVTEDNSSYFRSVASLFGGKKKVPVVALERDLTAYGIPSVTINNREAANAATRHLLECGSKVVGHLTGPLSLVWSKERLEGYKEALSEQGVQVNPPLIVNGDFSLASGYLGAKQLLERVRFDGLFAANDLMAIGAAKALTESGICIPEEVRIIGFDNISFAALASPPVSTVDVPKEQMGEEAARLIISAIEEQSVELSSEPALVTLPVLIIQRRSTNLLMNDKWEPIET